MKLLIDHKMINVCFHLITGTMAEQDLVALVKRLEAVALKLESSAGGAGGAGKSLLFYTVNIFDVFRVQVLARPRRAWPSMQTVRCPWPFAVAKTDFS